MEFFDDTVCCTFQVAQIQIPRTACQTPRTTLTFGMVDLLTLVCAGDPSLNLVHLPITNAAANGPKDGSMGL